MYAVLDEGCPSSTAARGRSVARHSVKLRTANTAGLPARSHCRHRLTTWTQRERERGVKPLYHSPGERKRERERDRERASDREREREQLSFDSGQRFQMPILNRPFVIPRTDMNLNPSASFLGT